ncbi:MAG: PepSY domain-containing protein [Burkholderiaceae bacterium]|nr:PepSY domain-containing protein [Burkholderiaceae bacterium]
MAAWIALAMVVALPSLVAVAGERDDHRRAREAVLAGEAMPLPELLERVARTHPGQVLELELEREDGRWIYEVKLLQPGGRIVALEVDARSAELLKQRSRDRHPPEPGGR